MMNHENNAMGGNMIAIHPKMFYFVWKKCTPNWKICTQQIRFNDLLFVLEGHAEYTIDGRDYHIKKGDIVFIKSQSTRSASTTGMECVSIDFYLEKPEEEALRLPVVSSRPDFDDFRWLFQDLNYELLQKREGYQLKCQAYFALIIHKLLFEGQSDSSNAHIETVKRYIIDHYDEKLTVKTLAQTANINPVYCGALFKRLEGRSISSFINSVRINKAAALLETGEYNVGEVAEKTGFSDVYYFSNTFKRLMGVSPNAYKNEPTVRRLS
jgi:AraC-like DNA-binding protein